MLKAIGDPARYVRFRMSVSVPPASQEEVTFIYNVFKRKTQLINEKEHNSSLLSPYNYKPVEQIFYRHSKGGNRLVKFNRFIDIIYDVGHAEDVGSAIAKDIYDFKLSTLLRNITSLKGIMRLDSYHRIFDDEPKRELVPYYKIPTYGPRRDKRYIEMAQMNKELTRATVTAPYWDVQTNHKEVDYSKKLFDGFDFNENFQVHTIKTFIGKEAIDLQENLIDPNVRDKLLYGFDGFGQKKSGA